MHARVNPHLSDVRQTLPTREHTLRDSARATRTCLREPRVLRARRERQTTRVSARYARRSAPVRRCYFRIDRIDDDERRATSDENDTTRRRWARRESRERREYKSAIPRTRDAGLNAACWEKRAGSLAGEGRFVGSHIAFALFY